MTGKNLPLVVADLAGDLEDGLKVAAKSVDTGAAAAALEKLVALTQADDSEEATEPRSRRE
mgnify:CR=1 FL=1